MRNDVDVGFCASKLLTFDMGTHQFSYDTVPKDRIPTFRSVAEMEAYNAHHERAENPLIGPLVGVTNIWNDLTADQLQGPADEEPSIFLKEKHFFGWFSSTNPIAFSARGGVEGLLQIVGFAESPHTVKLRYRLVQHEK
jgi:hypothetical protein